MLIMPYHWDHLVGLGRELLTCRGFVMNQAFLNLSQAVTDFFYI